MENEMLSGAQALSRNRNKNDLRKEQKKINKSEISLEIIVEFTKDKLQEKYPDFKFFIEKQYSTVDIIDSLKKKNPEINFHSLLSKSFIKPDGGFLFVEKNNKKFIILISEAKHQKSEVGNAFERSSKNISVCQDILFNENYFPYVLFIEGSIAKSKSLTDRVASMNHFYPLNKIHVVEKRNNLRPFTLIIKKIIDRIEKRDVLLEVAEKSLTYLISLEKFK